jgi:hypothetical protein
VSRLRIASTVLVAMAFAAARPSVSGAQEAPDPAIAEAADPVPEPAEPPPSPPAIPPLDDAREPDPGGFHFELGARGSYASPPVRGGVNPLGFGAGGGLDFVFAHLVLGASVTAYAGASTDSGTSERAVLYGIEAGYELRPRPWLAIRPMFGLGGAMITDTVPIAPVTPIQGGAVARGSSPVDVVTQATSISGGGGAAATSNSTVVNALYLAPGVLTTVALSSGSFIGVGGRVLYFPNVSYSYDSSAKWLAYSLDLNAGLRF